MRDILPFMGKRRSKKIKQLIHMWENKIPTEIMRREVCYEFSKTRSRMNGRFLPIVLAEFAK